jgi:hypothetical protein
MPLKTILRVYGGKCLHFFIALGLGQDRGGRDGGFQVVAFDDGAAGKAGPDSGYRLPAAFGGRVKRPDGALHGQQGGVQDIQLSISSTLAEATTRPGRVLADLVGQRIRVLPG